MLRGFTIVKKRACAATQALIQINSKILISLISVGPRGRSVLPRGRCSFYYQQFPVIIISARGDRWP